MAGFARALALAREQRFPSTSLYPQRMLSPQTQTNLKNAKSYFEQHLAVGDYYAEAERVVGQWAGKGATMLGLDRAVAQSDFVALCENAHPRTGGRLTQRLKTTRTVEGGTDDEHRTANRRVFYDFTFSPPKSVSVVALVSGDRADCSSASGRLCSRSGTL